MNTNATATIYAPDDTEHVLRVQVTGSMTHGGMTFYYVTPSADAPAGILAEKRMAGDSYCVPATRVVLD